MCLKCLKRALQKNSQNSLISFFQISPKCSLLPRCPQPSTVTVSCHVEHLLILQWSPLCFHLVILTPVLGTQPIFLFCTWIIYSIFVAQWNPVLWLQLCADVSKHNYGGLIFRKQLGKVKIWGILKQISCNKNAHTVDLGCFWYHQGVGIRMMSDNNT